MVLEDLFKVAMLGHWKYIIITLIVFMESLPLIGLIIPGQTLLVIAGFASHENIFNLYTLIFLATLAVIAGDCISYYVGRRYGLGFLKKWGSYFLFNDKNVKKTEKLIINHLGKSLILGHLYSFTRAIAPFLAGTHRAPFPKFLILTSIGSFLWATTYILIGYFIGESFKYFEKYIGLFIFLSIIIALSWHFLGTYLKKKKIYLLTKSRILGAIIIVLLLFFFSIMNGVIRGGFWTRIDEKVLGALSEFKIEILTSISKFIHFLFDPFSLAVISLIMVGFLLQKNKKREVVFFVSTMLLGLFASEFFKWYVHRPRPQFGLLISSGFSFPSGHALISTIFLGLIAVYFFIGNFSKLVKKIRVFSIIFLIILVGASRIYLNVHWFSDVIAGITLGIAIVLTAFFFWVASEKMKTK